MKKKRNLHGWRVLTGVLTAVLCGMGCKNSVQTREFKTPATKRSYAVYTKMADGSIPDAILFVLHDYGSSAAELIRKYDLKKRVVESKKWAMVIPIGKRDDQKKRFWNGSEACCGDTAERPNDLIYLREVLFDVRRRLNLEGQPVYVLGIGNGGFMAYRWACHPSADLTALISVAGAAPGPLDGECRPSKPIRVLHVHGDKDEVVDYYGRYGRDDGYPSAKESVHRWVRLNGLGDRHGIVSKERSLLLGKIVKERFGEGERQVSFWTIVGGGHQLRWLRSEIPRFLDFFSPAK